MIQDITAMDLYKPGLASKLFQAYQHALELHKVKPVDRILEGFRFIRMKREYHLWLVHVATWQGYVPLVELRVGTFTLDKVQCPHDGEPILRMLKGVL